MDLTKFSDEFQNLAILQEECNEIIHIGFKIRRFGFDNYHPKNPNKTNIDLLTQEIGDMLAIIDILKANGTIDEEEIILAKHRKIKKLEEYYTFPIKEG